MRRKIKVKDTLSFIQLAEKRHNKKYNYSKVEYINTEIKVCIICPLHGKFWQSPQNHLQNHGCPECGRKITIASIKKTNESFVREASAIHGHRYDYSKTDLQLGTHVKVCMICPIHGDFWQRPDDHLGGHGCWLCAREIINASNRLSVEEFISLATKIHKGKYNYSCVNCFRKQKHQVTIICPVHGSFKQCPAEHLQGHGCRACVGLQPHNLQTFIAKASVVHALLDKGDCEISPPPPKIQQWKPIVTQIYAKLGIQPPLSYGLLTETTV